MTLESLYPFLHAGKADVNGVLNDVARSTVDKLTEIGNLRRDVLAADGARIAECAMAIAERFARGGRLVTFGNGGSSTDAAALATLFCSPAGAGRPLPASALPTDVATLTALSNDVGFELVFARQIAANGRECDVAAGLSTSGGSANVLRGFARAYELGMLTVGFAGYSGGAMGEAAERGEIDYLFVMPSASVHRIQEAQTTTYHVLAELVQHALK